MEKLGISNNELLENMIAKLKAKLSQAVSTPSCTGGQRAGQVFSILSEAKDDDARKRQGLLDFYFEAERFFSRMDEQILTLLKLYAGNVEESMKNHKMQLEQKEYFLLVAGETSSGKSSLINLILGEDLLPSYVLSTTSTICELKYGEERQIVVHFQDKDPETGEPTKTIVLEEPTGPSQKSYHDQISPYVHLKGDREKGSIFKKIELFWPHSLLQKGIVIVDSPGVGESDKMEETVVQYLPEAFAFIYVINCANAGGIQKDRLEKLLQEVRKISLGVQDCSRLELLLSKCALFVCNKWDQVPEEEIKPVKNHVTEKLQKLCPGLDPESQIIYMSAKNANYAVQNYGYITEDFSSLMNGVETVVLKSIEARLEFHWSWLDYLLSRIVFQAKVFVMNASRDSKRVRDKITQILLRLESIEKQQDKVMADLRNYLNDGVDDAVQELSEYLSSADVKARFTTWTLDEVPKAGGSWNETEYLIKNALSSRLREIIEKWEEDNKVFANACHRLLQHFQQRYNFVEGQLRNLQVAVTAGGFAEKDPPLLLLTLQMLFGYSCPVAGLSLAGNVLGLSYQKTIFLVSVPAFVGAWMLLKDWFTNKTYEGDECAQMAKRSADFLAAATQKDKLKLLVKEELKQAELFLAQIGSRIPELIQADKMLYEELIAQTRTQKESQDLYQPIMNEVSHLRGQLVMFGIEEVCFPDISEKDLDWKEDAPSRLGCGTFGAVYQGTIRRNREVVALKLCNDVVDAQNACSFIEEVENLREKDSVRMILVMEKCKGSLKSHIFKHPEFVPGKSEDSYVIREACRWVEEITDALAYIHEKGIVHRDLKLENILLSEGNSVRIADVGLSKPAVDITGTFAGTPVYMAPEVIHRQVYDSKADIYSLGIILWEMWYGQRAFKSAPAETLVDLFSLVDDGFRPGDDKGCKPPPIPWRELMEKCWKGDPEERPSAETCKTEAKAFAPFCQKEADQEWLNENLNF